MIYPPQTLTIKQKVRQDDGIGGFKVSLEDVMTVKGYVDLVTATDLAIKQNAITEESTHIAVIPEYTDGITTDMQLTDEAGKQYAITYADNPVGIRHHLELYLSYLDKQE